MQVRRAESRAELGGCGGVFGGCTCRDCPFPSWLPSAPPAPAPSPAPRLVTLAASQAATASSSRPSRPLDLDFTTTHNQAHNQHGLAHARRTGPADHSTYRTLSASRSCAALPAAGDPLPLLSRLPMQKHKVQLQILSRLSMQRLTHALSYPDPPNPAEAQGPTATPQEPQPKAHPQDGQAASGT